MFKLFEKIVNFIGILNVNMVCDFIYFQEEEPRILEKYRNH